MSTDLLTIEVGHESTRNGIIVQIDGVRSGRAARRLLEDAFEIAGCATVRAVTDPGWWAIIVGQAALEVGPASIQRVPDRAVRHAALRVERGRMLEVRPAWPMARLSPSGPWLDLRGEAALQHGPSDAELLEYAKRMPEPTILGQFKPTVAELARMFDMGVLEWESGDPPRGGRRGIRGAR